MVEEGGEVFEVGEEKHDGCWGGGNFWEVFWGLMAESVRTPVSSCFRFWASRVSTLKERIEHENAREYVRESKQEIEARKGWQKIYSLRSPTNSASRLISSFRPAASKLPSSALPQNHRSQHLPDRENTEDIKERKKRTKHSTQRNPHHGQLNNRPVEPRSPNIRVNVHS